MPLNNREINAIKYKRIYFGVRATRLLIQYIATIN